MNISNWKFSLCVSGPILCGLAIKVLKKMASKNLGHCEVNEVLFYGAEDEKRKREIGLNNLYCINFVIGQATRTVDVCVPSLESETIAKSLIEVKKKNNARIRIAIHGSNEFHNLDYFTKHGIEVKMIKSMERLEHEFILIDASEDACGDSVALMGSLDYEACRVNCNRDTTMLVSEEAVLISLRREFDRVWNSMQNVISEKLA